MLLHDKCLLPRTLFNQSVKLRMLKTEILVPNEGVAREGSWLLDTYLALLNCNELTNCRYPLSVADKSRRLFGQGYLID